MTINARGNPSPRDMSAYQLGPSLSSEDEKAAARRTLAAMTLRLMPGGSPADRQWRVLQLAEMLEILGLLPDQAKHPEDQQR